MPLFALSQIVMLYIQVIGNFDKISTYQRHIEKIKL